jgi:hypothetical protein
MSPPGPPIQGQNEYGYVYMYYLTSGTRLQRDQAVAALAVNAPARVDLPVYVVPIEPFHRLLTSQLGNTRHMCHEHVG